jgi:hypothetical protein
MKGEISKGPGKLASSQDWSNLPSSEWSERSRTAILRGDPSSDYATNVKPTMANLSTYTSRKK